MLVALWAFLELWGVGRPLAVARGRLAVASRAVGGGPGGTRAAVVAGPGLEQRPQSWGARAVLLLPQQGANPRLLR